MHSQKSFLTVSLIGLFVIAGIAAVQAPRGQYKNLQILPKDISSQQLDSIMESYNVALGIGCSFCHTSYENMPDSLDYASDKNEMKENARKMMRMTIEINKNYFYFDKSVKPEFLNTVHCQTCHRGEPYPLH